MSDRKKAQSSKPESPSAARSIPRGTDEHSPPNTEPTPDVRKVPARNRPTRNDEQADGGGA